MLPLTGVGVRLSGSHINATALIRGMFHQASSKPQPGAGVLPIGWLDEARFMGAAVRKITGSSALRDGSLSYGEPMGEPALREALARRMADINIHAQPDQIMTTVGATQALDIVSRTLLKAGDPVMVEEPGWSVEFARLDALGMRVLPVPRGPEGPDLAVMARYCELHAPKLFVSVSVLHNPTGYSLSPGSAHQVLQLAQQHNFHVVEDDTYGHIAADHATRLTALDGLRRTIYVSGFAKILAPNWRVGYLAAPPDLVERLLDTKLLSTLTTPSLLEKALALCIEQGQLRRHADRMRLRLAQARARSVQLALEAGCSFAAEPAGMFGWVETGVDTDMLAQRMLDEGYLIAPGALFHATRRPCTLMRINFCTTQDPAFWRTWKREWSNRAEALDGQAQAALFCVALASTPRRREPQGGVHLVQVVHVCLQHLLQPGADARIVHQRQQFTQLLGHPALAAVEEGQALAQVGHGHGLVVEVARAAAGRAL